jgi:uncharacterized protein YcbX
MTTIAALYTYPIKSCAGVSLHDARCDAEGLVHDRRWMVVDECGRFLSQREAPRLALVRAELRVETLRVGAPGMLRIELPLEVEEDDPSVFRKVTIWNDLVDAIDEGDYIAQWLSDFLGRRARLVKLAPDARRPADDGGIGRAPSLQRFTDACPVLVVGQASLDDLKLRLAGDGAAAVPMNRFRPNIVVAGLAPYAEDHVATATSGSVTLKAVRRCVRCEIPDIDQNTGERTDQPMRTLAGYRSDPAQGGAVTFGVYCIVSAGAGGTITVGQSVALRTRAG